ncbi:MAG: ACT domain-containing protein, partial [Desulfobacterales bacterium]
LISVEMTTSEDKTTVSGTIFGKNDPRIVKINNFELELAPEGHLTLISSRDKAEAIGSIGTTLGSHNINIFQMQVGREKKSEHNYIFLRTERPIPDNVIKELTDLPLVKTVKALTF